VFAMTGTYHVDVDIFLATYFRYIEYFPHFFTCPLSCLYITCLYFWFYDFLD